MTIAAGVGTAVASPMAASANSGGQPETGPGRRRISAWPASSVPGLQRSTAATTERSNVPGSRSSGPSRIQTLSRPELASAAESSSVSR